MMKTCAIEHVRSEGITTSRRLHFGSTTWVNFFKGLTHRKVEHVLSTYLTKEEISEILIALRTPSSLDDMEFWDETVLQDPNTTEEELRQYINIECPDASKEQLVQIALGMYESEHPGSDDEVYVEQSSDDEVYDCESDDE